MSSNACVEMKKPQNSPPGIGLNRGSIELNPIPGGGEVIYLPLRKTAVISEIFLRLRLFFATFSFYLLHAFSENFRVAALIERKLQGISQEDVTRMSPEMLNSYS